MEYRVMAQNLPSDPFVRGYLECAEWSGVMEMEDGREASEAMELAVRVHWTERALLHAALECEAFLEHVAVRPEAQAAIEENPGRAGHDFWLTRNRHGAGFWDGDYPSSVGAFLTEVSHSYGDAYAYFNEASEELSFD